jgi:hypothetical protein
MKLINLFLASLISCFGIAQTTNFGLVYKVYKTTYYNPLDSTITYDIYDSTLVRLAKTNPTTCYVQNAGPHYLKDEAINMTGTAINTVDSTFIFIGLSKMYQLSLVNGAVISSVDLFNPLAANSNQSYFNNFVFNQSDTSIYGLATRDDSLGNYGNFLAKVNTSTGLITEISPASVGQSILMAGATIDPYQMIYYYSDGIELIGLDLYNGSIYNSDSVTYPVGFSGFGNFAYSCFDNTIYGLLSKEFTSLVPDPFDPTNYIYQLDSTNLFLGTINPATGQVSCVGVNPIQCSNNYLMNSGGAIDPATSTYYFNDGEKYIGVSLATGLVQSACVETFEEGEQFILFRNNTNCVGASFIRLNPSLGLMYNSSDIYKVFPNPTTGTINIQSTDQLIQSIELLTLDGQSIFSESAINSTTKNLNDLSLMKGIYFLIINNATIEKVIVN